jgi:DNA mismatch repair protein MSH5
MFRISTLEMFSLRETMFVNADTLHSLQILGAESHPASHNRGPTKASSGAKEGLSVYGLFHHLARTPQGRFLLRQNFLRPSLNLDVINERLETITTFLRPDNDSALDDLVNIMKNVGNMRVMMINLRKGIGGATKGKGGFSRSVWQSIRCVSTFPASFKQACLLTAILVRIPLPANQGHIAECNRWRTSSRQKQGMLHGWTMCRLAKSIGIRKV